ncbi:Uncharacterised protein [Mycobacteroides abscessus subsp. abscessus]|nr:Uncharacterised protein [Mycobacteroides abscessus subsp. abscessus]
MRAAPGRSPVRRYRRYVPNKVVGKSSHVSPVCSSTVNHSARPAAYARTVFGDAALSRRNVKYWAAGAIGRWSAPTTVWVSDPSGKITRCTRATGHYPQPG